MRVLVFFLEEPSAKAMLNGLLPRLLPGGWQVSKNKRFPGDWHSPFHRKQSFPKFRKIHFRGEKYSDLRLLVPGQIFITVEQS
jgi:hypothetical protein